MANVLAIEVSHLCFPSTQGGNAPLPVNSAVGHRGPTDMILFPRRWMDTHMDGNECVNISWALFGVERQLIKT